MEKCLSYFEGIDRSIGGFEGLQAAQECIKTNESKDAFAKDFIGLSKVWEAVSPDPILNLVSKRLQMAVTSLHFLLNLEQMTRVDYSGMHLEHRQLLSFMSMFMLVELIMKWKRWFLMPQVIDDLMKTKDPKQSSESN